MAFTQVPTAWADCAPNAAILAGTIYRIANVPSAVRSEANTFSLAIVRYVVCVGKNGRGPVRTRTSRAVTARLAMLLRLAIRSLECNICKLERTEALPLLIAARKQQLAKIQAELAKLR